VIQNALPARKSFSFEYTKKNHVSSNQICAANLSTLVLIALWAIYEDTANSEHGSEQHVTNFVAHISFTNELVTSNLIVEKHTTVLQQHILET
jgi:hypothetical protein